MFERHWISSSKWGRPSVKRCLPVGSALGADEDIGGRGACHPELGCSRSGVQAGTSSRWARLRPTGRIEKPPGGGWRRPGAECVAYIDGREAGRYSTPPNVAFGSTQQWRHTEPRAEPAGVVTAGPHGRPLLEEGGNSLPASADSAAARKA